MSESLVRGTTKGYRNDAVTSAATVKVDLTAWVGRYVKIRTTEDLNFAFNDDNVGDLDLTAGVKAVDSDDIPDQVVAGAAGAHRHVSAAEPWVFLRAVATTATVTIKPTSEDVGN